MKFGPILLVEFCTGDSELSAEVDDFSGALMLMLLNGDCLTKLILTYMNWSKELYQIMSILHIDLIMLIDALSISDVFSDSYTLTSLKRDDPETQKRLWLHHINRTPDHSFEIWSSVHRFESSVFKQFLRIASPC